MADSEQSPLVSCEWLQGQITSGDLGNTVILDVSWSSQRDCQQEFQQCHIPGADYLNVMMGEHTELFPRNLPTAQVFQQAARAAGVQEKSHVIVYSNTDNCGFFLSGRAWWTFKVFGASNVSILNGGLQRWVSLGYATESGDPPVKTGDFTARCTDEYRVTFDQMTQKVTTDDVTIVDSRAAASFNDGHVRGAHSLPASQLVDKEKGEMMTGQQLTQLLSQAGVEVTKPLVSYCNSGMSSCTLAFAYKLAGGSQVAVYHGGFTEWKKKAKEGDGNIEKSS